MSEPAVLEAAGQSTSRPADVVLWCVRRAAGRADPPPVWAGGPDALRATVSHHRAWLVLARHGPAVPGLPPELLAEAARRRDVARRRQLQADADLSGCAAALDAAGVPWACFKGPVLAAVYQRAGEDRGAVDLDLLVPPDRLGDALRALSSAGAGLLSRNFTLLRRELPGEVALLARHGTTVDLHWAVVNRVLRRRRTRISTAALLAAAQPVELAGRAVPGLQRDEALVHVCLHAALAGASRLSWLLDVTLSAQDRPVDWARVRATAERWGVPNAVGLVLQRSARLLDAPVPAEVLRALVRRDWSLAEGLAGRGTPRATADRGSWAARLPQGSLEHRTVVGLVGTRLRRRLVDGPSVMTFTQSPDDPNSALHASGDAADLAAYLDAVAREPA